MTARISDDLTIIENQYINYNNLNDEIHKKQFGQYFTDKSIADYMSSLFINKNQDIKILDCGAGNGILSISLINKLSKYNFTKNIELTLYEIDNNIIPLLTSNLNKLQNKLNNINIKINIIEKNFILDNNQNKFDYIISNPPYFKINKSSEEAVRMNHIVFGQPNIYMLFMAKSIELLRNDGEMVFITPRSFTSGSYFKKFRDYLKTNSSLQHIHIFKTRNKHFKNENILQETIITKLSKKIIRNNTVTISSSDNSLFANYQEAEISQDLIINSLDKDIIIKIPTTKSDIKIIEKFVKTNNSLKSLGYTVSTGKVVKFRNNEFLLKEYRNKSVPLYWMNNFKQEKLEHPLNINKEQYIINTPNSKKLLIKTSNYLIIKRFSSKEQKRRINLGYILKENIKEDYIGLENHLNYLYRKDSEINKNEIFIIGNFLGSIEVDKYFRITNGNTQVNASELMNMPIPNNLAKEIYELRQNS